MKTKLLTLLVLIVVGGLVGCVGPGYDYGPYGPGYGYYPGGGPVNSYGYPYPGYGSSLNFTYIHRSHDLRHRPTFHDHRGAYFNGSSRGDLHYRQDVGRRDFRQSAGERSWQGYRNQRERVPEFISIGRHAKYGVGVRRNSGISEGVGRQTAEP